MNTNLIMSLVIQLVAALKEPTPPENYHVVYPRTNGVADAEFWQRLNARMATPLIGGSISNSWTPIYTNSLIDFGQGAVALWRVPANSRSPIVVGLTNQNGSVTNDANHAIRQLAKSGRICEVLGHRWEGGRVGEGPNLVFADYHPGTIFRHCSICGAAQSKTEGEWK